MCAMQASLSFTIAATIVVPIPLSDISTSPRSNTITFAVVIADKRRFSKEEVEIDFNYVCVNEDEALILCTDGLSGLLSDSKLLEIYQSSSFEELAEKYIEEANNNGGKDNITVVVMKG